MSGFISAIKDLPCLLLQISNTEIVSGKVYKILCKKKLGRAQIKDICRQLKKVINVFSKKIYTSQVSIFID